MRWRHALLALGIVATVSACMPSVPRMSLVGQRSGQDLDASWQATLDDVRRAGFVPASSDPTSGRIVIDSQHDIGVQYVVQLYREGWVQLLIEGDSLRRWNAGPVERPAVGRLVAAEYQGLAVALARGLSGGSEAGSEAEAGFGSGSEAEAEAGAGS